MDWQSFFTPPPLHPILVHFTAALVPVSFLCDLLGRMLRRQSLLSAGWWTLVVATVVTPLTALSGWLWMRQLDGMDHAEMFIHRWMGISLSAVLPVLAVWRGRENTPGVPGVLYLVAAGLFVLALSVQGHLGGMMSFGAAEPEPSHSQRHGSGGYDHEHTWSPQIELKE